MNLYMSLVGTGASCLLLDSLGFNWCLLHHCLLVPFQIFNDVVRLFMDLQLPGNILYQ